MWNLIGISLLVGGTIWQRKAIKSLIVSECSNMYRYHKMDAVGLVFLTSIAILLLFMFLWPLMLLVVPPTWWVLSVLEEKVNEKCD